MLSRRIALALVLAAPSALAKNVFEGFWKMTQENVGKTFYDNFNFNNISDPTHGRVVYVDRDYADSHNLTYAHGDHFVLRPESIVELDPAGPGRPSVRLISKQQFGPYVIVADVRHMPQGCGTWPALWEKGNKWPDTGEIDIIEGINDVAPNLVSLHTNAGCEMLNNTIQKGTQMSLNCDARVNSNQGCGVQMPLKTSYGPAFNNIGGGFFAMERSNTSIKFWYWPRNSFNVPLDVRFGLPVIYTKLWGTPDAYFNNDACDMVEHFQPAFILINLTLCGDWAGGKSNWVKSPCAAQYETCVGYINAQPGGLSKAYFDFKGLRIYEAPDIELDIDIDIKFKLDIEAAGKLDIADA